MRNYELCKFCIQFEKFISDFQFYNLIPTLTVQENVALGKKIAPDALDAKQRLAEKKSYKVGDTLFWRKMEFP